METALGLVQSMVKRSVLVIRAQPAIINHSSSCCGNARETLHHQRVELEDSNFRSAVFLTALYCMRCEALVAK